MSLSSAWSTQQAPGQPGLRFLNSAFEKLNEMILLTLDYTMQFNSMINPTQAYTVVYIYKMILVCGFTPVRRGFHENPLSWPAHS